jgi:NlpC/P60 family putative phage cell wall peptidase
MTRAEILAEARSWIGTPWLHQASCKGVGADCIGFGAGVAAACGSAEAKRFLATPEWRRYGRHPEADFLFRVCDELMDRIEISAATVGDVLVFNCGKHPMHFGIVGDDGRMLHAYLKARRVCEHQLDAGWRARIERAYRIRGVE